MPRVKALFLPYPGREEPLLGYLRDALGPTIDLATLNRSADLLTQFAGVDAVIDQGGHATHEMIDAGAEAGVKLWQVSGNGLDHTPVGYILRRGIRLANTPGPFSAVALAEHSLLLMLNLAKNMRTAYRNVRNGEMNRPVTEELAGSTLGLVGYGASARELAVRARAMAMRVVAVDVRELSPDEGDLLAWFGQVGDFPRLLGESDYVSLHVPLTIQTRHLIDGQALSLMKPTGVLINVARGGLVDEGALVEALKQHRIRGAGVDVFSVEPPPPDHPLLHLENVVATPHIAGTTWETQKRRACVCAENVRRLAEGQSVEHEITDDD